MPVTLVLGTVQFGVDYGINNPSGKPGADTVNEILAFAYHFGITQLDTADGYGNAKEIIGKFHKKHNLRFEINSKFAAHSVKDLRLELLRSLEELHIATMDTWFFHGFRDYISRPELLQELENLKVEKLVRKIGVSVYTNSELKTVINDPLIDTIQLPFNLLDNLNIRGPLLMEADKKGKTIQVRSVFLQGLFFKDISTLPVYLWPLKPYLEKLHAIADENEIPMESLCLQYAGSQKEIHEIVFGVDSKEQLIQNLQSFPAQLLPEIVAAINKIKVAETELLYPYNWK